MRVAKPKLDEMCASFPEDVKVQAEVLVSTNVANEVANYAKKTKAAFIAVSTHGRTGLRRLVLGSVADAILRHSTVPVVCFPMKE